MLSTTDREYSVLSLPHMAYSSWPRLAHTEETTVLGINARKSCPVFSSPQWRGPRTSALFYKLIPRLLQFLYLVLPLTPSCHQFFHWFPNMKISKDQEVMTHTEAKRQTSDSPDTLDVSCSSFQMIRRIFFKGVSLKVTLLLLSLLFKNRSQPSPTQHSSYV